VDVFKALAEVFQRTDKQERLQWDGVQQLLTKQFAAASFAHLGVRLPRGLGYPIKTCIESWKDQQRRVVPQLMQETSKQAQHLATVSRQQGKGIWPL